MNRCVMLGRLTKDTELKFTPNGTAVASFTLAVNRRFVKEGEQQADFINCVAWGKTAEFCGNYFKKGMQVAVEGRIQTRTYDNKEGKKMYVTEVVCDNVYFADSKKEGNNQQQNDNTYNDNPFMTIEEDPNMPF